MANTANKLTKYMAVQRSNSGNPKYKESSI